MFRIYTLLYSRYLGTYYTLPQKCKNRLSTTYVKEIYSTLSGSMPRVQCTRIVVYNLLT